MSSHRYSPALTLLANQYIRSLYNDLLSQVQPLGEIRRDNCWRRLPALHPHRSSPTMSHQRVFRDSIRAYSDPDRLGFVLILSSNCGLDREATEASAEGEFIRSRVDKLPIPVYDWELILVAKANLHRSTVWRVHT